MVVWNLNRGIRSQGCFFVSPRWGKSKKRVLNAIIGPSSTRLFALLGKAHPKWWYETEIVEFGRKGVFSFCPDGESRKNAFWTQLDDLLQPGFFRCLEKPTQNGGMKPKSWNSIARVFCRFASMVKDEKTRFERNWTTFENPGFLRCLEKPTQNGGMKPKSWNSIARVFFRFAPMGKVEKTRFERNWTTFFNPAFCAASKSPPKMVVWNRNRGIRSQGCFLVLPRWGKSKKRVLNAIIRPSSTRLFALLGKAHPKWWYETEIVEFDRKSVFSFRPDGESRKNAFWTQLYDLRQPGFLRCLEKPTQNGGMKPKSWNSIARVFFRFAPMGKVEKTRFERNYRTFVNPAFCAAWKSPPKMVVWNRNRGIRSQGCFLVLPRWGKSKKRVLNAIGRPSSTRLFPLLGKAHPKWWYETEIVEFDRKGFFSFRLNGERRKNAFRTQLDDLRKPRLFALLGKAHPKWWYETEIVEFDRKGVFSFRPDGESRKNAFWTKLDDLLQPGFLRCLEKPTQNGGMKPKSWNSVARVFSRFAPMGKVEKTRFERNWTTFFNPAFCAAWKKPTQNGGIKPKSWNSIARVFFRFASMVKDEKTRFERNWTTFENPAFLRCLEKPTQNGGMKPKSWNSIARVFFRFASMGKVEETRFERNWTTFVNQAFIAAWNSPPKMVVLNRPRGIRKQGCFFVSPWWGKANKRVLNAIGRPLSTRLFALLGKAHPKWWYETEIVEFDPKGVFSFRPDGKVEKTRFERNWTTFVSQAFIAAWNSPAKMVVWNRPRGIRSQGCFFGLPRWGKSRKCVLSAIGRPSSTRRLSLLGIAHPKWWYETDLVEFDRKGVFSFRPDWESRKNAFWTKLDDLRQPGFLRCLEKPTQNCGMKPTSRNSIPRVFIRFAPMGKVDKTCFERNWTTFVNPAFCAAWKSPPKMVVWNQNRGIRSQGCFFVSPRWGKSKKRVLNAIGRPS